jgi:hypothetical protein
MGSIIATGVAFFITGWLTWIWVVAIAPRLAIVHIQQIGIYVHRRKSQMHIQPLTLSLLPETFAVCRLETEDAVPQWVFSGPFLSITHTSEELSLVCPASRIPLETKIRADRSWCCFKLHGPIPFSLTGILNSVTVPLAQANIGIFAISTYDTDHVLVQEQNLHSAIHALREAGHTLHTDS